VNCTDVGARVIAGAMAAAIFIAVIIGIGVGSTALAKYSIDQVSNER
jgi:hypothetical protein